MPRAATTIGMLKVMMDVAWPTRSAVLYWREAVYTPRAMPMTVVRIVAPSTSSALTHAR